ncbi:hypothetical protein [Nostocoides sp. HKS02]|uniref:hypothetical protein n=1 Tax=Nostocoides sp. HKS02 TaxID=1813880 RepID=UPI0012B4FF03|nr:hypothetical protein [Tetrasphaera sp. HKS02]QGN59037.1 hypothetical protein GKE56_15385 [Tetrasphaera sp. HKS02]
MVGIGTILVCAVGCSGDEGVAAPHDGALRLGGDQGTVCVPATRSGDYTFAQDAVNNSTDAAIEVTDVSLVNPDHASMSGVYLAPIIDKMLIGVSSGWPPSAGMTPGFAAKRPVPTRVDPHEWANLVVHINAQGLATIDAVEVTYVSHGVRMRVRNSTRLMIRPKCS